MADIVPPSIAPYYQDDAVTLYLGDCREITAWLDADVLVTDPPYGVAWPARGLHSSRALRKSAAQSISGDESTQVRDDALVMWGSKPAVIFGSWREARPKGVTHRLIWHKAGRKPGVATAAYFPADEEIYLIGAGWQGSPTPTVLTTTEARERQPAEIGHPTPKPLGLMERLIEKCPPGVIADPFSGSGATLIAAKMLGRRAVGVEEKEAYCEITANRLTQDSLFGGAA